MKLLSAALLRQSGRLQCKCMDAAIQFFLQKFVNGAVALNATHSGKSLGNDTDAKVCFAGAVIDFMMTALFMMMPGVEMTFINDFKPFGERKSWSVSLPSRFVCYCEWTFGPLLPI